jgi:hypothetical protein
MLQCSSLVVFLNGNEIGSSDTFATLTAADFSLGSGSNTLTFVVTNTVADPAGSANPTALDFGVSHIRSSPYQSYVGLSFFS